MQTFAQHWPLFVRLQLLLPYTKNLVLVQFVAYKNLVLVQKSLKDLDKSVKISNFAKNLDITAMKRKIFDTLLRWKDTEFSLVVLYFQYRVYAFRY